MVDQSKKDLLQGEIKAPEKISSTAEQAVHYEQEGKKNVEKKEIFPDEKIVSAELKREIEMMQLDPAMSKDAEVQREKIEYLGEQEKIEHLLTMAREKGLVFAIQIARKMNEPYLLDVLHDTLSKEGFYRDFVK